MLLILYFVGYERPAWNPPSAGISTTMITGLKVLAMGFGPGAFVHWNGMIAFALIVVFLTLYALIQAWKQVADAGGRKSTIGLLLLLINYLLFVMVLGWGRAGMIPRWGLPGRYTIFTLPVFILIYLILAVYGPARLRTTIQYSLLFMICALLPWNTQHGLQWRNWYTSVTSAVETDIAEGKPALEIALRNKDQLVHWYTPERLAERMHMLRRARIGPFSNLNERQCD
jgi:hypothetical protein